MRHYSDDEKRTAAELCCGTETTGREVVDERGYPTTHCLVCSMASRLRVGAGNGNPHVKSLYAARPSPCPCRPGSVIDVH